MKEERDSENSVEQPEETENTDPFAEYPTSSVGGENPCLNADKPKSKEKKRGLKPSKKIAYCAAATAISVVAAVISVYLPVRIMPLVVAAFCFFLAHVKCGVPYGILTAAATELVAFLCGGLSSSLILVAVCFFPYSLLALPLRRFGYRSVKSALIRAAAVIAFANVALAAVYFISKAVLLGGLDVLAAVGKVGYALAAVIVSAAAVVTDFLFVQCDALITPKIK